MPCPAQYQGMLQSSVQWEAGHLVVPGSEGSRKILVLDKGFRVSQTISYPLGVSTFPDSAMAFFHKGEPWVFCHQRIVNPKGDHVLDHLYRYQDGQWKQEGSHEEEAFHHGFDAIVPLENGRFFGVRIAQIRRSKGLECPFYILKADAEGKLQTVGEADGGIPPKLFDAPGLPRGYQVIRTGAFFLLVDPHPGWIWVYSLENGNLKRLVRVYEELDEKRIQKNDFSSVVIGAQAMEDDTLLLAVHPASSALSDDYARRMEAGLQGGAKLVLGAENSFPNGEPSPEQGNMEMVDWAWKHHPEVRWVNLDPATGKMRELDPPPEGARTRIESMVEGITFNWMPVWDGRVEFRSLETLLAEGERAIAAEREAKRTKDKGNKKKEQQRPSPTDVPATGRK